MTFMDCIHEYYKDENIRIMRLGDRNIYFAINNMKGHNQLLNLEPKDVDEIVNNQHMDVLHKIKRRITIMRIQNSKEWMDARMYELTTGPKLIKELFPDVYEQAKKEKEKRNKLFREYIRRTESKNTEHSVDTNTRDDSAEKGEER